MVEVINPVSWNSMVPQFELKEGLNVKGIVDETNCIVVTEIK
jgi:hypothetical protein